MVARPLVFGVSLIMLAVSLAGCTGPTGPGGNGSGGGAGGKQELVIGTILPQTGDLQRFGVPTRTAADKAAEVINGAAGGRFNVRLIHEDSQTTAAGGTAAANKLRTDGVSGIVGADGSSISIAVQAIAGPNHIVQISPMSTSPQLTEDNRAKAEGERYFFRTTPSDALQGKVAGAYAITKNWTSVVLLHLNNAYGNGLRATFTQSFQGVGGGAGSAARVVKPFGLAEKQTSYDSVLQQAFAGCTAATRAACPSGVFLVAYPDTATQLMSDWWSHAEWRHVPFLMSEGVQDESFFKDLQGRGVRVEGIEGTAPIGEGPAWSQLGTLLGGTPSLFQAHTFDAVMLLALAAEKANDRSGESLRANLRSVGGPPGEKVGPNDYARAVELLKGGGDIDYDGAAGSQNFDEFGDVTSAYEIYRVGADGSLSRKCQVPEAEVLKPTVTIPQDCRTA